MQGTAKLLFAISGASLIVALILVGLVITKRADIMDVSTVVKSNQGRIAHVEDLIVETRREHTERLAASNRIATATEETAKNIKEVALVSKKSLAEIKQAKKKQIEIAKTNEVYQKKVIELLGREAD